MKIKHVYGNVLKLDIPLTIKIRTMEGDVPTEREEPFYPDVSKGCAVIFGSSYNRKIQYDATVSGNVAHIEDDGVIGIGTYKVTVKCYDEEGNPYRYMVRDIIEICDATIDAGIEAGVEFNAETYTLEGAVFVSYGGGSEQVQADWTEADIHSKAYIKHKPTNLVEDESYVHTDNNYTNAEKEKLADLENYDDSGIRQELDGKVDKVAGKGLSTNDYTNEDKSKLNSALQSETDPTVSSWAKQPNKPSYTAQEVGALPNSTKYGSTIDLAMNSTTYVLTLSLKDQDGTVLNTKTVDLPIESVVVNGRYDAANKKIVLTLQSGSTIDVPVGDLVAGLQTEITSVNMLDADLVDDTNSTHKFVTDADKSVWNGKQATLVSGENIKTVNGNTLLGSGNIAINEIAEVTYGVSTYNDVKAVVDAGKLPIVKYDGKVFVLSSTGTGGTAGQNKFVFSWNDDNALYKLEFLQQGGWSRSSADVVVEKTERKVTDLNTLSDFNYPTVNAVRGYAQPKITAQSKLNADLIDDTNSNQKLTNATEKAAWNGKYTKPAGGIPASDLADDAKEHAYVDLGLPSGTLWATMNVGAASETDAGNYYMYGKGATEYQDGDSLYRGTEEPLALSADTARQAWGGDWHMPTKAQIEELLANTTALTEYNQEDQYRAIGTRFTAQNGNYIIVPNSGCMNHGTAEIEREGFIWSSTPEGEYNAYFFEADGSGSRINFDTRSYGMTVRPVKEKTTKESIGLSNVTNDRQVKGLASGTTQGHVVTFGADGYTIQDSGVSLNEKQDTLTFNTPYNATTNKAATMADIPASLPANGGNAATVNNHSVNSDVPANAVFTDTTYSTMGASGSGHAGGLVPDTPSTAGTTKYLREDGTWAEPAGGGGGSQVQSDWNQSDNTAVDYIKNKPTIPVIPTNVSDFNNDAGYLTQHQDISGKADKSEMSVTDGTGADSDKTTIQLKSGTSATVLKSHQSLAGKQDALVSGTNIKTINNESILGSGNITIQSGEFIRNLSVDFQQNADTVQFVNLYGDITITKVAGINVATLKISYGNVLEQSVTLGNTDIDIEDGDIVTLKITRTTDLQDAALTLKFEPTE